MWGFIYEIVFQIFHAILKYSRTYKMGILNALAHSY